MRTVEHSSNFTDWQNGPPLSALGEDGIQVALEDGGGVLEVLFGVGFGGGDTLERLVQNADNPPLFSERGVSDVDGLVGVAIQVAYAGGMALHSLCNT